MNISEELQKSILQDIMYEQDEQLITSIVDSVLSLKSFISYINYHGNTTEIRYTGYCPGGKTFSDETSSKYLEYLATIKKVKEM